MVCWLEAYYTWPHRYRPCNRDSDRTSSPAVCKYHHRSCRQTPPVSRFCSLKYKNKIICICRCVRSKVFKRSKFPKIFQLVFISRNQAASLSVYKFKSFANELNKNSLIRLEWPLSVCLMMLLSIILDCCSASTFRWRRPKVCNRP